MTTEQPFDRIAYLDGTDAGYRLGKYMGMRSCPDCPYPDGTAEYYWWWEGFGDATEFLINPP